MLICSIASSLKWFGDTWKYIIKLFKQVSIVVETQQKLPKKIKAGRYVAQIHICDQLKSDTGLYLETLAEVEVVV